MPAALESVIETLRGHQEELRRRGVLHAAVFGSVARGEATPQSDVDILIDLDPGRPMGLFAYARLKIEINRLLGGAGDIVNRATLKPLLRDPILREAVDAF